MFNSDTTNYEPDQKWEQPFRELLSEIYWPGYAENLARENPTAYQREYYYFISLYDYEPKPII